jgi:non-ribosomal peptide synthetase component F
LKWNLNSSQTIAADPFMPGSTPSDPADLLALFDRTVGNCPKAVALMSDEGPLTYSALAEKAARLAARLQKAGIHPGAPVGVCVDRSAALIATMAAYVPIDPAYPAERIAGMLEDAKPPVVITNKAHQHLFKGTAAKVLLIEDIDLDNGPLFEGPCPATPETCSTCSSPAAAPAARKAWPCTMRRCTNLIQWQLRTSAC